MCWDFSLLSGLVGVLALGETQRKIPPESRVDFPSRMGDLDVDGTLDGGLDVLGGVVGGLDVLGGVVGGLGVLGGGGDLQNLRIDLRSGGFDLEVENLLVTFWDLSRKSAVSRLREPDLSPRAPLGSKASAQLICIPVFSITI